MVPVFTSIGKSGWKKETSLSLSLPRYETDQLISLVGSKRSLGDQLRLIISSLAPLTGTPVFLDPFCGSGAVSRIARSLGMDVRANDVEPFSYILNHVYLTMHSGHLTRMFTEMGGIDAYLSMLHLEGLYASQTGNSVKKPYISRYYAPQSDTHYDANKERLFFTAANARYLDVVREEIEESWLEGRITAREKAVVLAAILFEASRKANTSGSFTSYHKQFYTATKAVRTRIVEPCMLQAPLLPDEHIHCGEMHLGDAADFVSRSSADICYLDPPATVHQYGSSYHMLNSITLWDNYKPSQKLDEDGKLTDRSGIRKDWKQTYSPFCSIKHADKAFIHLFERIDARHIVLTYPTRSVVDSDRILELLSVRNAPVTVVPLVKRNQGGRQSADGKRHIEQVFITGKPKGFYLPVGNGLDLLPMVERLDSLLSAVFRKALDYPPFSFIGGIVLDGLPNTETLMGFSPDELNEKVEFLESQVCKAEEQGLTVLLLSCANGTTLVDGIGRARLEKRLFSLLRRMVASMERSQVKDLQSRLVGLLEHLGPVDSSTTLLSKRLSSFFTLAYDREREAIIGEA
jgi:adenine-specific DNA-methyltransferase